VQFTLGTVPYVDACMWTYGAVSHRMLTQGTADANYMLLTVVVSGHNCLPFVATAMDNNAITLPW